MWFVRYATSKYTCYYGKINSYFYQSYIKPRYNGIKWYSDLIAKSVKNNRIARKLPGVAWEGNGTMSAIVYLESVISTLDKDSGEGGRVQVVLTKLKGGDGCVCRDLGAVLHNLGTKAGGLYTQSRLIKQHMSIT